MADASAPAVPIAPSAFTPPPVVTTPPPATPTPTPIDIDIDDDDDDDDDPTVIPTGNEPPARRPGSLELKTPAALPRKLGIWGDMRYVFTAVLGVRRIKRELAETEAEIEAEKRSRDKELAELARLAIADESVTAVVVEDARERLVELEGARSRKAGAAAAAEEAIGAIMRDRDKVAGERNQSITNLEAEIEKLSNRIEPLEKDRAEVNRAVREFKLKVDAFDKKIEAHEGKLESGDPSEAVEAEAAIASLRAERATIAAEEPVLAEQLAAIEPELRDLKARRGELHKKISKLKRAEDESVVRSEERVAAARAHKLVVERAASDMSREQTELLTELGQKLYDNPPPPIVRLALPLKERVATVARLKDRAVSLREERASLETMPLVRGALVWLAIAGVAGVIVWFTALR